MTTSLEKCLELADLDKLLLPRVRKTIYRYVKYSDATHSLFIYHATWVKFDRFISIWFLRISLALLKDFVSEMNIQFLFNK